MPPDNSTDQRFALYARYYDLLYADKDYAGEAAYVAGLIRQRLPGATRILELGSGTGIHAEHLARLGFTVHGIDLSDSMVAGAQARKATLPPELAAHLSFSQGDARSVRVGAGAGQDFDAVITLFHVMSYQISNADLQAAHDTAAWHLAPGGVFVHDHWWGPAVLTQQPTTRVRRLADAQINVTRIAEPVMRWRDNVCEVNYTMLIAVEGGDRIEQFHECHPMRYLFAPELELFEAGHWRTPEHLGWMSQTAPDASTWAAVRVLSRA
jgi:SAM-dependent methyltransferase